MSKALEELRQKTLSQVAPHLSYFNDCKPVFAISECKSWINKIFDDVEALQHRSSETCRYLGLDYDEQEICRNGDLDINIRSVYKNFCCNRHKPKENL